MKGQLIYSSSIDLSINHILESNEYSDYAILVDSNTEKKCLSLINDKLVKNVICIPSGESSKSIEQCSAIWEQMTNFNLDRKAVLINLGGGVICDIGAFCASTYKRGIAFIHIPTSLLAMTDAAIGGKAGINFGKLKNHIGLFNEAIQIIINPIFLETLPGRELKSGYAEILKHAIISGEELWSKTHFTETSKDDWKKTIELSSAIKNEIIQKDFRESGLRKSLNLGHSIGHLIESFSFDSNNPKTHGEAIAEGIMVESFISYQKYLLSEKDLAEIINRINSIFNPTEIEEECEKYILENIGQDKKNAYNKFLFALPEKIGKVSIEQEVKIEDIKMAISNFNDYLTP